MGTRGRPTLETLAVILAVFATQWLLGVVGWEHLFVLALPLAERPWALVTSVYAHLGTAHLVGNAIVLLIVGPLVARRTTRAMFHAFFVVTGALAGVAEVVLGALLGSPTGVLGASGAIFALLGYLLAGNVVSTALLNWIDLSARVQLVLVVIVVVGVTLATAGARTALFGHATGLAIGLVAGRLHLVDRRAG